MVWVVLVDVLQSVANELVSREALVGIGVSKHHLYSPSDGLAVFHWGKRIFIFRPRIRKHVSSETRLRYCEPCGTTLKLLRMKRENSLLAVLHSSYQSDSPSDPKTLGCRYRLRRLEPK